MGVCMCGFCNLWVYVCEGFVICVFGGFCNVCVCVCVCVCLVGFVMCCCVFCNVWVFVCVGFVMCGCVYVWVW